MKVVDVTCGYKKIHSDGSEHYFPNLTDNGECYKDLNAFENGIGVIYIGESDLSVETELTSKNPNLWTRTSWMKFVENECYKELGDEIIHTIKNYMVFIEYCSRVILEICDWEDLSTKLIECCGEEYFFLNMKKEFEEKKLIKK